MSQRRLDTPFNIEIMELTKERLSHLRETTSLAIFDGATREFEKDGLFSAETFTEVGNRKRDITFSYIALKTTIFHPKIFEVLHKLKRLYSEIITGKSYATWDDKAKDFVKSNPIDGDTGFHFFVKHWEQIKIRSNSSTIRKSNIKLIEKYKDRALTSYILILPAGLRDIEIVEQGRISDDPVNDFYRSIIMANNIMPDRNSGDRTIDKARITAQLAFCDLFEYFMGFLSGKTGWLQRHVAQRAITYGTRNVITAMSSSTDHLDSPRAPTINDSYVGIYQHAMSIQPITIHYLQTGLLQTVFGTDDGYAYAVNKKTLKAEYVELPTSVTDQWTSFEGLNKVINRMKDKDLRHKPVHLGGQHYLALIYTDDKDNFKIFHSIDELPEHLDKDNVRPITLIELIYLCGYREWSDYPSYLTRYPVLTSGSSFAARPVVKTTVKSEIRYELNEEWERYGKSHVAADYPLYQHEHFVDTISPNFTRIDEQGADFDGDKVSYNTVMTEEAIEEAKHSWRKADAFLTTQGNLRTQFGGGAMSYPSNLLAYSMTRRKRK